MKKRTLIIGISAYVFLHVVLIATLVLRVLQGKVWDTHDVISIFLNVLCICIIQQIYFGIQRKKKE